MARGPTVERLPAAGGHERDTSPGDAFRVRRPLLGRFPLKTGEEAR